MKTMKTTAVLILITVALAISTMGQTTAFSYQGNLTTGGSPANGNYDLEFALFDAVAAGNQLGSTLARRNVSVTNGVFAVSLDFGPQFPGGSRFLEIRVRIAGGGSFTILTPRHQVNSSPYSVKSINAENATTAASAASATNALQLGGVAANQYVVTTDPRLSDARQPVAGNSSYVQNRTTVQTGTNFNISGVGNASVFNAATQFNLNGARILGIGSGTANTFGGINAGANASNLSDDNTFFGNSAGQSMVTAGGNSFFGSQAGQNTTSGSNTFVGAQSGKANTTGDSNSFFGLNAGTGNTTGDNNAYFGRNAGSANQTGSGNSFFGYQAGLSNTTSNNSFFGFTAGKLTTGINNSFFGWSSGAANTTGTNNAFFGVQSGLNNQVGIDNAFFGRDAGRDNISGSGNSFFGRNAGLLSRGDSNTFIGLNAGNTNFAGTNNTAIGANSDVASAALDFATAIGAGAVVDTSNTIVLGRSIDDVIAKGTFTAKRDLVVDINLRVNGGVYLDDVGGGGLQPLCHIPFGDGSSLVTGCSSSIRYKENVDTYSKGLSLVNRLRPVSFNWKSNGMPDIGFVAEEVASVEPLLTTTNKNGEVEGVKYDRINVVLINGVKEQQAMIESQSAELADLKAKLKKQASANATQAAEIRLLRKAICSIRPRLTICAK